MRRLQLEITGQVQGVGFRPHVLRIAQHLNLTGWVRNHPAGVNIEIQGLQIDKFLQVLLENLPALAKIDSINQVEIPIKAKEPLFIINESLAGNTNAKMPADASICQTCLSELFNSNSRFYLYPFITCTECGPRYTITKNLPFDRQFTSMDNFILCKDCQIAYGNPHDCRFHAESIACSLCGPKLTHSISEVVQTILSQKVVALKSLGGFQLICDARSEKAVAKLREEKRRNNKPFAIMALNIKSTEKIAHLSEAERTLLQDPTRPIVLLTKKNNNLSPNISPNLNSLGVMLPSQPLHYLIFNKLLDGPVGLDWVNQPCDFFLVVTSANFAGSPILKDNDEAKIKLFAIANLIVGCDRKITTRVDDSVVRVFNSKPVIIRRGRGFVPEPIKLPFAIPSTLGLGGYLKNTVCLTRGNEAFLSQHVGDLNNRDTISFYRELISHLIKVVGVEPHCVAHDLHPDFYSTRIAKEFSLPSIPVQHHYAHLAACAAEHGIVGEAIGLALDGFGLSDNYESWGGELIYYQQSSFKHLGSLKPLPQPGADKAVTEPWRMAAGVLYSLGQPQEIIERFAKQAQAGLVLQALCNQIKMPITSSCGRLFDAASSLLGVCELSSYEGEAAMRLESLVTKPQILASGWKIEGRQLNLLPLFAELKKCDPVTGANLFHGTLAAALVEWVVMAAEKAQVKTILLSGGCFLNKVLTEGLISQLCKQGLVPYLPERSPPNDGGLSLGQAWVAGLKLMESDACA